MTIVHSVSLSFLLVKALLDRIHHLGKCFLNPQLYLSISVSHRCIFTSLPFFYLSYEVYFFLFLLLQFHCISIYVV